MNEGRDDLLVSCQERLADMESNVSRLKREQEQVSRTIDGLKDEIANEQVSSMEWDFRCTMDVVNITDTKYSIISS